MLGRKLFVVTDTKQLAKGAQKIDIDLGGYAPATYLLNVMIDGKRSTYRIVKE